MKIVILDGYTENPGDLSWEGFTRFGELTVYDRTPQDDEEEILRRIGDAEIVIINKVPLTASIIDKAPKMSYIGVLATGYDIVDINAAKNKGIPVTNIPAYGTLAVAQHTMAHILEICSQVGSHNQAVKEGKWENSEDFCFWETPLTELAGKTIGIIGYGRIGQEVGRLAEAFHMNILAHAKHSGQDTETCHYVENLDELFTKSDIITLHCPLFPETKELINKETIAKMKDGVIIINTARGGIINAQDLADALNSGKVYAAGIDVVTEEPIKPDNPLLHAKNCYITPHIAWASKESRQRLMDTAVANVEAFMKGERLNDVTKGA